MATRYDIGDTVTLTGTFTDSNGDAADPTAISLVLTDPSGNDTTYTYALGQVTKSGVGVYYKNFSPDESGTWYYKWTGTGTVATADVEYFVVE